MKKLTIPFLFVIAVSSSPDVAALPLAARAGQVTAAPARNQKSSQPAAKDKKPDREKDPALTIATIQATLDQLGVRYIPLGEDSVAARVDTENYIDRDGDKCIIVIITLSENGAYLKIFAPHAFDASGPHVDAMLRVCMMIQWRALLIQFEYDARSEEIWPIVEFPLQDSRLTPAQFSRSFAGLCELIDMFYPAIERARTTGEATLGSILPLPGDCPPPPPSPAPSEL